MNIGVDAMGGDFAPQAIVEGAVLAANELPEGVTIVLIGQTEAIQTVLDKQNYTGSNIKIVEAN